MNENTVSKEKSQNRAFFSFVRSLSPSVLWSASHTRRRISGAVFQGECRVVLYSLAVNTVSTDGFQTVSPHAGSQWILGLFIVAELEVYRALFFCVHSFTRCIHSVILRSEPPSMMESLFRALSVAFVPPSFLHPLPKYVWPCVRVSRESNDAAGAIIDGKLTALLLCFHSLCSKSDRRGIRKKQEEQKRQSDKWSRLKQRAVRESNRKQWERQENGRGTERKTPCHWRRKLRHLKLSLFYYANCLCLMPESDLRPHRWNYCLQTNARWRRLRFL